MKIATWNVNSIRTRIDQVLNWLEKIQPDLLCLQETKVVNEQFPLEIFLSNGYQVSFDGQKSYNGVALISPHKLDDVRFGFQGELPFDKEAIELSSQKRIISALIENIRVVNLYVPNGSSLKSDKYNYKLKWLKCLKRYLEEQSKRNEPICILGDFNIALEDKDIHNPTKLSGGIMASNQERKALKEALGNDLRDVFRIFEQDTNHWSWWDYRSGGWERGRGWRIDHIYLSEELISRSKSCEIHKDQRGNIQPSDHAPVLVDIDWGIGDEEVENEENDIFSY